MSKRLIVFFISILSFLISDSLTLQNLNLDEGTVDVYMVNSEPLGGMQFGLPGLNITGAFGGRASDAGWEIINCTDGTCVLGFSFSGASIPSGEGVLVTLSIENQEQSDVSCIENQAMSTPAGEYYYFDELGCINLLDEDLPELEADVYTWISNDNGETMEISFYHPDHDISGFQLEFDDCALLSAENGDAGNNAGFTISAGNSTVLGFSFTGATIPASDEVETLVYVDYQGENCQLIVGNGGDDTFTSFADGDGQGLSSIAENPFEDSTLTLQEIIDQADEGSIIHVIDYASEFNEGTIYVNKEIHLVGNDVVLDLSGFPRGFIIQSNNVTIEGFEIIGNDQTIHGISITPGVSNIAIYSNTIHGMSLNNESGDSQLSYGILAYGDGEGGPPNPPSNVWISNNYIYDISGSAISLGQYTQGFTISGNVFNDIETVNIEGEDISVGIQAVFTDDLNISNNNFSNVRVGTNIALCTSAYIGENSYEDVDIYHSQLPEDEIDWDEGQVEEWYLTSVQFGGYDVISYFADFDLATEYALEGTTIYSSEGEEIVQDCLGVWNGESEFDECGECGGNGELDCAGVCDGDAFFDDCGECVFPGFECDLEATIELEIQNVDFENQTLDIYMSNIVPVAGFQFHIDGANVLGVGGGAAADNGFTVSTSPLGNILAFSLSGETIPPGNNVLLTSVSFDNYIDACINADEFTSPLPINGYLGDLNLDEVITVQDIVLSVSCIIGDNDESINCSNGDVNLDGIANVLDIISLINVLIEVEDSEIPLIFSDYEGNSLGIEGTFCGDWNGDPCTMPENTLHVTSEGEVLYNSPEEGIAGFQFDVDGATVLGASGGDSMASGFTVSTSPSGTVLGFSFSGATFGPSCGTMLYLELEGEPSSLSNITISNSNGEDIGFIYYYGFEICGDESACNYGEEEDCEYPEENYDCDGNCIIEEDCFGECGGGAVEDECGECGGDGSSCFEYDPPQNLQAEAGYGEILLSWEHPWGDGSVDCQSCDFDYTDSGSECCDTAWVEFGISCADLEANYTWDCSGCSCPGDIPDECGDGECTGDENPDNCPEDCNEFSCGSGEVLDCADGDWDCCPESWIGDGYPDCEDQQYGCDLTCYDNDGGDCGGRNTPTAAKEFISKFDGIAFIETSDRNTRQEVTAYNIYRSIESGGSFYYLDSVDPSSTTYLNTDPDLISNQEYYYVVTAIYDDVVESEYSNEASATPMEFEPPTPTNLQAEAGDSVVNLSWDEIEFIGNAEIGAECWDCSNYYGNYGGSCIYDCELQCVDADTAYSWIGDGFCDDGYEWNLYLTCPEFECDGCDCGSTEGCEELCGYLGDTIPNPPSGDKEPYHVSPSNNNSQRENFIGYNLYRSIGNNDEYSMIALIGDINNTSYQDEDVENGTRYYYRITSLFEESESGFSNETSATPMSTIEVILASESGPHNQGDIFEIEFSINNPDPVAGIQLGLIDSPESVTLIGVEGVGYIEDVGQLSASEVDGKAIVLWFDFTGYEIPEYAGHVLTLTYEVNEDAEDGGFSSIELSDEEYDTAFSDIMGNPYFWNSNSVEFETGTPEAFISLNQISDTQFEIHMENYVDVAGVQFTISDSGDPYYYTSIEGTDRTPDFMWSGGENDQNFSLLAFSLTGSVIEPGSGPIAVVTMDLNDENFESELCFDLAQIANPEALPILSETECSNFINPFSGSESPYYNVEIDQTGINQLIIFQDSITGLEVGDEIGLFDANGLISNYDCSNDISEVLVGSGIWTGEQLEVLGIGSIDNCAFGGFQLPGWLAGNSVVIKVYRPSEDVEYQTTAIYSAGTGTFGDLFMAIAELTLEGGSGGGSWDGDACSMPENTLHVTSEGEVLYNSPYENIAGFQFQVEGISLYGASGGDAGDAGFMMSTNEEGVVLGFSLTGATFGPCGTMLYLDYEGEPSGISAMTISDSMGEAMSFTYFEGGSIDSCDDENACNYGDEGECWYPEDNDWCDCEGNYFDECGECGGPGGPCGGAANMLTICNAQLYSEDEYGNVEFTICYDFNDEVAGFQMDLLSDNIVGYHDWSAQVGDDIAGWLISANSEGTVIGFDLAGSTISGSGELFRITAYYNFEDMGTSTCIAAIEDCDSDGYPDCNGESDTRLALSDVNGNVLESEFEGTTWQVGTEDFYQSGCVPGEDNLEPSISVDPNSFYEELDAGDSSNQMMTIFNNGNAPLDWELNIPGDEGDGQSVTWSAMSWDGYYYELIFNIGDETFFDDSMFHARNIDSMTFRCDELGIDETYSHDMFTLNGDSPSYPEEVLERYPELSNRQFEIAEFFLYDDNMQGNYHFMQTYVNGYDYEGMFFEFYAWVDSYPDNEYDLYFDPYDLPQDLSSQDYDNNLYMLMNIYSDMYGITEGVDTWGSPEGIEMHASSGNSWLSVSETSGSIAPYDHQDVEVYFDASNLGEGYYSTDIEISSNASNSPNYYIPVSLEVNEYVDGDTYVYINNNEIISGYTSTSAELNLYTNEEILGVSMGIDVYPNNNAPELWNDIDFYQYMDGSVILTNDGPGQASLFIGFDYPMSGNISLGELYLPIDDDLISNSSYYIELNNVSGSTPDFEYVEIDDYSTDIFIFQTFTAGDVRPFGEDLNNDGDTEDVGEFGDGLIVAPDILNSLLLSTGSPDIEYPDESSNLFDAFDVYPQDVDWNGDGDVFDSYERGGDGYIDVADVMTVLRTSTDTDGYPYVERVDNQYSGSYTDSVYVDNYVSDQVLFGEYELGESSISIPLILSRGDAHQLNNIVFGLEVSNQNGFNESLNDIDFIPENEDWGIQSSISQSKGHLAVLLTGLPDFNDGEIVDLGTMVVDIDFVDDQVFDLRLRSTHLSGASSELNKIPVEGSEVEIYLETAGFLRPLNEGANLVSFYTLPVDQSVSVMLDQIDDYVTEVIGPSSAATLYEGEWIGNLEAFDESKGYYLKSFSETTGALSVSGFRTNKNQVYNLDDAANLISYPFASTYLLEDIIPEEFNQYIYGVIGEGQAAILNPETEEWVGSLESLRGTYGYWIISYVPFEFNYSPLDVSARVQNYVEVEKYPDGFEWINSSTSAYYFVEDLIIEDYTPTQDDWLIAYYDGSVVGARPWMGSYTDVPVMGQDMAFEKSMFYIEDGMVPEFKLLSGNGQLIDLYGQIPAWNNLGLYNIVLNGESSSLTPEEYTLSPAYPNPFNPITTIEFGIPEDNHVDLRVFDMNGRLIEVLVSQDLSQGLHQVQWNASAHSSGIYMLRFESAGQVKTQKLVLVK